MITTKRASILAAIAIIFFSASAFILIKNDTSAFELMNRECAKVVAIVQVSTPEDLQTICKNEPKKYLMMYSMVNQFQALTREKLQAQLEAIDKLRENSCEELLMYK
jgi:hypothetical protein